MSNDQAHHKKEKKMPSNHKLTHVITGRSIAGVTQSANLLQISFSDGSTMKIKVAASFHLASASGTIDKVRQGGTELDLDLSGGHTLQIQTAEATSCVMLRDKSGALEYAD